MEFLLQLLQYMKVDGEHQKLHCKRKTYLDMEHMTQIHIMVHMNSQIILNV